MEYITKSFPIIDPITGKSVSKLTKEIECLRVPISQSIFSFCKDLDDRKIMSYNDKRTAYGKGAYKGNGLVGLLGEAAAGIYFGLVPEWSFHRGGDGGFDFIITGRKTDVKTAQDFKNARNLIRRAERGRQYPLKSIIYIGGYIEDRTTFTQGDCCVILIGYTSKRLLEKQPILKSRVLPCDNTEMYFADLAPIRGLLYQHQKYIERHKDNKLTTDIIKEE